MLDHGFPNLAAMEFFARAPDEYDVHRFHSSLAEDG